MRDIKSYMAGIVLPSLILPFVYCMLTQNSNIEFILIMPFYLIPVLWGLWNIILIRIHKDISKHIMGINYVFIHGALLAFFLICFFKLNFDITPLVLLNKLVSNQSTIAFVEYITVIFSIAYLYIIIFNVYHKKIKKDFTHKFKNNIIIFTIVICSFLTYYLLDTYTSINLDNFTLLFVIFIYGILWQNIVYYLNIKLDLIKKESQKVIDRHRIF